MINRRNFLEQLGVESETRRESGEDKREFAEQVKRDWLEFDLWSQVVPRNETVLQ
jgi:hypothetical protein